MKTIKTKNYAEKIQLVVDAIGYKLEGVEIVPSIRHWCESHNIEEGNLFRAGKCLKNNQTGKCLILISEEITSETISSIVTAMEIRGLAKEAELLNSKWSFLRHLLLHEIAHAIYPDFSELQCDVWAFDQMNKIKI